jgi:hypothetical protein
MGELLKPGYRLFISYRRDDRPDIAHHLYSWFVWHYGHDNVFMDFASVTSGARFREVICEEIKNSDGLVVIIGPEWTRIMGERAYTKDDYVLMEIQRAIEEKKLIVPIQLENGKLPEKTQLPKRCQAMLYHQGSRVESREGFSDSIRRILKSLDRSLEAHVCRRQEAEELDAISPVSGLALGYFENFLRPVIRSLSSVSKDKPTEHLNAIDIKEQDPPHDPICTFSESDATTEEIKIFIVIPPSVHLLVRRESLKTLKSCLKRAEIRVSGALRRSYSLDARKLENGFQLFDFPTAVTVLANWIERRMKHESLKPNSREAKKLERNELARFERMLRWWAEDELKAQELTDRVQINLFDPRIAELKWLTAIWKR